MATPGPTNRRLSSVATSASLYSHFACKEDVLYGIVVRTRVNLFDRECSHFRWMSIEVMSSWQRYDTSSNSLLTIQLQYLSVPSASRSCRPPDRRCCNEHDDIV